MRWKRLVTIVGLLIIALMVAVYVILGNYDYNKLKPRIARVVKEATGRELNLGGEVDLTIGFSPALTVSDVTFANASWGSQPQMIKITKLQAQVRLLPLLFRDLQLKHIGFVGVDVLLETDQTGRGNWDFNAEDRSAGKAGAFKLHKLDIAKIRIENLALTFRDGQTGSAKRLTLAGLEVDKQGSIDSLTLDLKADYNGQQLTLAGKIGLIHFLLAHERFPLELAGKFSNATVKIDGAINDVLSLQGIDLQTRVSGTNLAELKLGIGLKLPKTNVFDLTGHLKGSKEALTMENVNGKLSGSDLDVAISGIVGDLIAISGIDLHLTVSGKDLALIGPLIGEKLPATDEFTVQGRLTGSARTLSLREAQGSARQGGLSLALNGEIKDLLNFNGVDLVAKGSGRDLSEVGAIIDEKLPATDEFLVEGHLTGSAETLSLQKANGSARRGSLSVALSGEVKDLIAFSGLDLQLKGSGKNLAEIGSIIGEKLPATDEFGVQGRLTGSAKTLSMSEASGSAKRGSLNVTVSGEIKDLIAFSGVDLKVNGSGKNLAEIGAIIDQKLPATDEFTVQGRLMGSTKALSLRGVQGRTGRGSLNLTFNGGIADLLASEGINIKLRFSGKDLAEIGPLVGTNLPKLGPFEVGGHLIGSKKAFSLNEFAAIIDRSDFKGLAKVEFRKRPKINMRLESSVVDFTALMKSLEKDKQAPEETGTRERRLFSDDPLPFDALEKVDADIVLKARNIHTKDARLEFGHLKLTLEDNDFSIDTLEATYKESKISGTLHLNPGSPPHVTTKFLVQDFDLGGFLKETGMSDQARGHVDIAADLKSTGNSVHDLMGNLNGTAGAVMGQGFLTKYLDLLAANLTQRVTSFWGRHKKAENINCAVVQLDIDNGLIKNRVFVVDSEIAILTVEGDTNLATEELNLLLSPDPKNPGLTNLSMKLRVTGPIQDPKIRPDMASLAIKGSKALSALLVGPIGLLAPFVHLGAYKKHPCDIKGFEQLEKKIQTNE